VGDYVKLKKAGAQNFSGLCPSHAEKTPSFSVHATRQFYHRREEGTQQSAVSKSRSFAPLRMTKWSWNDELKLGMTN